MKALKSIRNDPRVIRVLLALGTLSLFVMSAGAPHGRGG
jgi:hypothetical protein